MTTLVAAANERSARRGLAVSADAVALGGLGILVAVLAGLTWATWGDLGSDTGYDLVAAAHVAHGQFPYVDFVYYYGPLGPALLGLFMWLGGVGVGASVALGVALAVAIVFATYIFGRDLAGPVGGALAGAITAPLAFDSSNFSYVQPHSYSAPLGVLTVLILLIALGRLSAGGTGWGVVAGVAAGVTALTRPEFELAAIAAIAVWFVVQRRTRSVTRREVLAILVPAAGIPALVYGAFLTGVSAHRLLFDNLYPTKVLHSGGNAILRLHAPMTPSSFLQLGEKLFLYGLGCACLVLAARFIGRKGTLGVAVAVAVGCAALLVAAFRSETVRYDLQYAYGWIPAAAVLLLVAIVVRPRIGIGAREAALVAVLAVLSSKTYDAYAFHAHIAQLAVYSAPFAAIFMAWLHLERLASTKTIAMLGAGWLAFLAIVGFGLTVKDARAESFVVRGPGGAIAAKPAEGRLLQAAIGEIQSRTQLGEPILLAPQLTALYTLTGRTDPLPQVSLVPGALPTVGDERGAIARLQQAGVRLVVVDDRSFPEYGQTTFGGSFDRTIAAWIKTHFRRAVVLQTPGRNAHRIDVYVRRSS
jgi:hypothetical protein